LNNRIKSSHVQVGESLILSSKNNPLFNSQNEEEQEDDFKKSLEAMLIEASIQSKAIVEEAAGKADEIIKKAEEEALKKAAEAEILKQASIKQGFEEGFQKGYEEGIIQAKQELNKKAWGLNTLTSAAFKVKKEIIDSAEKEIIELSTAIAEKIIRHRLEIKPELMQKIIKAAIEQLRDKEEIKIIVNPAVIENLYSFTEELKTTIKGLKTIKITEDKTIPKDGVIVESPDSRIDGRIETQLSEIVRHMLMEFSEKSNSEGLIPEINVRIEDIVSETEENSDNDN